MTVATVNIYFIFMSSLYLDSSTDEGSSKNIIVHCNATNYNERHLTCQISTSFIVIFLVFDILQNVE